MTSTKLTGIVLSAVIIVLCTSAASAQKTEPKTASKSTKTEIEAERIKLAQRSAIDNFDVELQRVQFAAIRNNVRLLIVDWLWEDGQDSEYAGEMALKAFEELVKKDADGNYQCANMCIRALTMIEANAPQLKKRLNEKYKLDKPPGIKAVYDELMSKGSPKSVVDKMIGMLDDPEALKSVEAQLVMDDLAERNSPEFIRLLEAVLVADERNPMPADTLEVFVSRFRHSMVPTALRNRFYQTALKKGFAAMTSDDPEIYFAAFRLLTAITGDVPESDTVMRQQIEYLKTALKSKGDRAKQEDEEVYARIAKASDKLAATITEAEAVDGKNLKEDLYGKAIQLAMQAKKYQLALDLIDKLIETRKTRDSDGSYNKKFERDYDELYSEIAIATLSAKQPDISAVATQRIVRPMTRAELLRELALIHFEQKDADAASDKLRQAFKIVNEADADDSRQKINMFMRQIAAFQKADKMFLMNVTPATAKALDSFPKLDEKVVTDSPEYENYVNSVLYTSLQLLPTFEQLLKTNKLEAIDFANRVTRREFKVVAEYALMMDKLKAMRKAPAKSASATN